MHGGGIDQPLMAIRHEYSDSLPGARSIHPQTNARGQYDGGIGSVCTTITDPGTRLDEPHDPYDFPGDAGPPEQDPGPTEKPHCIEVDWPGKSLWPTMERQSRWHAPNHWSGSLLLHSRDPSGQYYRRNRFYDAGSGRFTQEDPIGIAGGLNVYGYANGDPISYSDPYGLCYRDRDGREDPTCRMVITILRTYSQITGMPDAAARRLNEAADAYERWPGIVRVVDRPAQVWSAPGAGAWHGEVQEGGAFSTVWLNGSLSGQDLVMTAVHESDHMSTGGNLKGSDAESEVRRRNAELLKLMPGWFRRGTAATEGLLQESGHLP